MKSANQHYTIKIEGDLLHFTPMGEAESIVHIPRIGTLGIDEAHPDYHHYEIVHTAANVNDVADISVVWQNLQEEPYPTLGLKHEETAKRQGEKSHVPFAGDVSHYIGNHVVVNVTQPGHILHPSLVVRYVFEQDGEYKIASIGIGNKGKHFLIDYVLPKIWQDNVRNIGKESKEEVCFFPRR